MRETIGLKKTVDILRELGEDWRKSMAIINSAVRSKDDAVVESVERLCRKSNQGNMVKIGLTLIAFPLPLVIDDVLGWSFLAAGLVQRKMKNSALYLEDVNKTFPDLIKELREIGQEMV